MLRMTMTSTMPAGHDGDRGCLHRQVPQIARRQEGAAVEIERIDAEAQAGNDVQADPDDQQRADHAEHAGIDLGRLQEPGDRAEFGRTRGVGLRVGGRVGHDFLPPACRLTRMPEPSLEAIRLMRKHKSFEKTPRLWGRGVDIEQKQVQL